VSEWWEDSPIVEEENWWSDSPVIGKTAVLDPKEEEKQIKDTLNISDELELLYEETNSFYKPLSEKPPKRPPIKATMSLVAYTPSQWEKFKNFFVGERPPLPPNADRIEKITRAFDIGMGAPLRAFMKFAKGMTLGTPDLMWAAIKRITPEDMWVDEVKNMTLDEAMDWAGGYDPSGFQKSVGEIAEFIGRLNTVAPIAQKIGIIGKTPKDISILQKASETAKLFGAAAVGEQAVKYAATKIDPTETEYGYEGATAVLRDMAIGAVFSLLHSGVKGAWSKLTPTEHQRALKLLGLKKGATTNEIKSAARDLFRKYHPDKAKGFQAEFERVVKARDILIKGEPQDIIFRGQKVIFKPKLLKGETVEQQAIRLAEIAKKPVKPIAKAPPTEAIPAPEPPVEAITKAEAPIEAIKPEQAFAIYKKNMPDATEKEVIQALLEDDLPLTDEMLEKYSELPKVQEQIEQKRIDRIIAERAKKAIKPIEKEEVITEIPPRPLVNPKASALQQDKQIRRQQAWDRKYGKLAEAPPAMEEKITPVIEPKMPVEKEKVVEQAPITKAEREQLRSMGMTIEEIGKTPIEELRTKLTIPKPKAPPKKEAGFVEIEKVIKAAKAPARWFLGILEPAKLTATKHGKEVVSTVMRGIHKPEAKLLDYSSEELESLDMTYNKFEDWLSKYPRDVQEQVMLTRGHGLEGKARGLQRKAFGALPKELKDSKIRRALDEIADFNYEYLTEVAEGDINKMRDYFYGIYKNPKKVTNFLDFWKTTEKYVKHKVFPTYADAKAYGLEIRDPNPVTNLKAEYRAIAHRASMKWLKEELVRLGEGNYIMPKEDAPLTWDFIGDKRIAEPTFSDVRIEPELAKLINNLISTNKITQLPVLDFMRKVNNFLRTVKFIGSAFHMIQIGKQSVADSGYLGFYKTTARHGLAKGFEKFDPIFQTPEYRWYIENGGGHRYSVESEARKAFNDIISKLTKSEQIIVKGVSTPLKLPVGFVNWMFNSYIPKVKYAKYLDFVAEQEKKLGRNLTATETQEIIKEQQNFYGMMNERLFGRSGTVTSALRFIFMAPGYAEGNYRTMIKAASQWGITPEGFRAGRSRSNIVNSWLITTTLATIGTLIFTGKSPEKPESIEEMRDLLKIDTGRKDEHGKKIMIDLATYDKDYWNVFFNTLRGRPDIAIDESITRIGGMKAPTVQLLTDVALMMQGKAIYDWKDDKVYHITDPLLEKINKLAVHEIQSMIPISASVYLTSRRRSVDRTISALEMLAGVRPGRTERDKKEFEIVRDIWDMREKQEELSYRLNKYDDPWVAVAKYNKTLDDLIDNKFVTKELKEKINELKIDPKKVITWKRFPLEKMTKEQIRTAIEEHTLKTGAPHKGWEDRIEKLREELNKRK